MVNVFYLVADLRDFHRHLRASSEVVLQLRASSQSFHRAEGEAQSLLRKLPASLRDEQLGQVEGLRDSRRDLEISDPFWS